jgi:uncharacterized protein YbjT (DUF2867 family)
MYVVAGVSGHVGSVVAKELLAAKQKIRVIVRDPKKGDVWSRLGAEVAVGELGNSAFLEEALLGAKGFFVLLPDKIPGDFYEAQRKMGDTIAAAVSRTKLLHVVLLSSLGADQEKGTGVLVGLYHFENALRKAGSNVTAIRATALQENIASAFRPAETAGIYANFYPSEDFTLSMVATRDVGVLAAKLLIDPPASSQVIDLEGPRYSARQITDKLSALFGKSLRIVSIPPPGHVEALMRAGIPKVGAEGLAEMMAAVVSGLIAPRGDRLERGGTPLDETLASLIAHYVVTAPQ